ncbi:MAG: zinc-dependent metalloprotease [Chloroflexi bacterium]|nr:zinc-dependent metalloprotease [Chloroflexota bacterium]
MPRSESTSRRLAGVIGASFLLGAVAGVAQGISRGRALHATGLIDWDRVYQVGSFLSGSGLGSRLSASEQHRKEAGYRAVVEQVSPRMIAYLGGQFAFTTKPEVLDRPAWIEANIGSFATVFEPVEDVLRQRFGTLLVSPMNQQSSSVALGIMLGYLSRRVLGQYDPALLGKEAISAGRLYFVQENLDEARRKLGLPADQFETWIVFHELTHSWQFEAHPWLREFMNERVRMLLTSASGKLAQVDPGELLRLAMRGEIDPRRPQRMLMGLMTPEQRATFNQLQALMSLLEGFSNHVMDALGPDMLPDYSLIARKFESRQQRKSPAEKMFVRLTGLEMKMEQYRIGEKFVDAIVRDRGIAFMNQIWESPSRLPSLDEIHHPSRWIQRIEAAG